MNYKFCQYCGRKIPKNATYCQYCGKKQESIKESNPFDNEFKREIKYQSLLSSNAERKKSEAANIDPNSALNDLMNDINSRDDYKDQKFEYSNSSDTTYNNDSELDREFGINNSELRSRSNTYQSHSDSGFKSAEATQQSMNTQKNGFKRDFNNGDFKPFRTDSSLVNDLKSKNRKWYLGGGCGCLVILFLLMAAIGGASDSGNSKPKPKRSKISIVGSKLGNDGEYHKKTDHNGNAILSLESPSKSKIHLSSNNKNIHYTFSNDKISVKMPDKTKSFTIKAYSSKPHYKNSNEDEIEFDNNSTAWNKYEKAEKQKKAAEKKARINKEYPPIQDQLKNYSNDKLFTMSAQIHGKIESWGADDEDNVHILVKDKAGNEFLVITDKKIKGTESGVPIVVYGSQFMKGHINDNQINSGISSSHYDDSVIYVQGVDHAKTDDMSDVGK